MSEVKTVRVPHLWGTDAGYQMPHPYDPSKPTCVLINSFTMTSNLYTPQFNNSNLTDSMNLIAIEPYGHGATRTKCPTFTYWDTAIMTLQVLDALEITGPIFALGTSQGGWIVVRMALLQPDRISGIIPLGTSMDYESPRSQEAGCWDAHALLTDGINALHAAGNTPDFVMPMESRLFAIQSGLGEEVSPKLKEEIVEELGKNYTGDDGRKRYLQCAINLRDRDGLYGRLADVKCPVLWLHGTKDTVYSAKNAKEEIELFVNAKEKEVVVVDGGQHFLSASKPEVVDEKLLEFVKKWAKWDLKYVM
jgi:pimeloyl-ACP methyl ester carboxylesterase